MTAPRSNSAERMASTDHAAHDHQVHEGESLRDAARARLTSEGEQWTGMREAVFEALAGFDKPASAYDIAEAVSAAQGRRIAANRVYRILDLFVSANLARRVESANAYVANAHPDCLHDCIFLICDRCGQAVHIDDDKLSGGIREAAKDAGFSAPRPVIEVRGTCGDCDEAGD
jgi:Fur family zinc uptake transcriptional regulator